MDAPMDRHTDRQTHPQIDVTIDIGTDGGLIDIHTDGKRQPIFVVLHLYTPYGRKISLWQLLVDPDAIIHRLSLTITCIIRMFNCIMSDQRMVCSLVTDSSNLKSMQFYG